MSMFTFTLIPDEGDPFKVQAQMRDVLVWEKTGRDRAMENLGSPMRASDMYELAFIAAKRTGAIRPTVSREDFEATHELELEGLEVEVVDPTHREASPAG